VANAWSKGVVIRDQRGLLEKGWGAPSKGPRKWDCLLGIQLHNFPSLKGQ